MINRGIFKWLNENKKDFGFIEQEGSDRILVVPRTTIAQLPPYKLFEGDLVTFEADETTSQWGVVKKIQL